MHDLHNVTYLQLQSTKSSKQTLKSHNLKTSLQALYLLKSTPFVALHVDLLPLKFVVCFEIRSSRLLIAYRKK